MCASTLMVDDVMVLQDSPAYSARLFEFQAKSFVQTNSTHRVHDGTIGLWYCDCVVCLVFWSWSSLWCSLFGQAQYNVQRDLQAYNIYVIRIARQGIGQFIRTEQKIWNKYQTMFSSKCLIQFGIWCLPATWHLVKSNCNWKIQLEMIIFFFFFIFYLRLQFECEELCYGFQCR